MIPENEYIRLREAPGSHALLIAFGDMFGGFGMSSARFTDLIAPLPSHQLLLKDPYHAWYQKGLPGVGDNPRDIARFLAKLCRLLRVDRLVTIGNSAGAYAAMLFGVLLQANEVHAFGPQTRLTHMRNAPRYPQYLARLIREHGDGLPFRDLGFLLNHYPHPKTRIHIYYSQLDRLDRRHAQTVRAMRSVTLIPRPMIGHELMTIFVKNGLLPKVLMSAVTGVRLNIRREASRSIPTDFGRSVYLRVRDIYRRRFKRGRPGRKPGFTKGGVLLVYPKGGPPSELAPLGIPLLKGFLRQRHVPVAAVDMQSMRVRCRQRTYHLFNRLLSHLSPLWIETTKAGWISLYKPRLRRRRIRQQMCRLDAGRSINTIITSALTSSSPHPDLPRLDRLIRKHGMDLVGFSVVYPDQLYHALLLARRLKEQTAGITILLGGAQVTKHLRFLIEQHDLTDIADGLIVKQGEHALCAFIEQARKGGDFDAVPNLYFPDQAGLWRKSRANPPSDGFWKTIPDFTDFRFAVLPLRASLGCPWGKCSFCTYRMFHDGYQKGRVDSLVQAMRSLQQTYKVSYFRIIDDFLTPGFLEAFSRAILRAGLNVRWWAFIALVPGYSKGIASLMKKAGCLSIETGLESMSPRILKLMRKPHTPELAKETFRVFHDTGIDITIDVMFGFPTETESDAWMTLHYLRSNRSLFKSINIQPFCLEEGTDIYQHPEKYGIDRISIADKSFGIRRGFPFSVVSGMSTKEVRRFTERAIRWLS
jgi:radical SAM superfamily enzyme YgiQ (UPF0313 family)/pimeloyl-ACP methyl ester carboxylesterase